MKNKKQSDTSFDTCENCFSFSIGRLSMQLKKLERHPKQYGEAGFLTPSEIHIINEISRSKGILMSELASRMGVTKGAITQTVSRMEENGFVRRDRHATDARAVVVSLTEKGIVAYDAHNEMHKDFCRKLHTKFSTQEIDIFRECIDKFYNVLKE